MKSAYPVLVILSALIISCSQEIPSSKVPSVVLNRAQTQFPGVNDMEWEKERNYFEAEFKIDSVEHSLNIDRSGNLLQHKWEVDVATLPETIPVIVQTKHPGYQIDEANLIDRNGQMIYELELDAKGKKDLQVLIATNGNQILENK